MEKSGDRQCESYSIVFPYHCYKVGRPVRHPVVIEQLFSFITPTAKSTLLNNFSVFPKVYASDPPNSNTDSMRKMNETASVNTINTSRGDAGSHITPGVSLEALARAYIMKESGRERLQMLFKKNHKGESSPQMLAIQIALVQIYAISFFLKYVPSWKFAKEEFIRNHNATAFRTYIDALRKMNDYSSVRAIYEGAMFATKITIFCTGFVLISQAIASYRNKTSVTEYTAAGGITGGLARLQMGPKGIVAGSVVGTVLGTIFGGVVYPLLNLCGVTQESRHLEEVMSRLEVEKSIIGDSVFKQRMKELTEQMSTASSAS